VVAGTRLPVRTLASYWRQTHDRTRILRSFPQLTPELLAEAMHYYEAHQAEIHAELRADEDAETESRRHAFSRAGSRHRTRETRRGQNRHCVIVIVIVIVMVRRRRRLRVEFAEAARSESQ
jgi:uncharacterized protein (DUF433 family)